jgi:hypothetical protein
MAHPLVNAGPFLWTCYEGPKSCYAKRKKSGKIAMSGALR